MMDFSISTKGLNDVIDITDRVRELVGNRARDGAVLIYAPHQTCAITVLEREIGLVKDFKSFLKRILSLQGDNQDKLGGSNARAHILAALIKPSLTIPLEDGKMLLGQMQQIVLIDFDNRPMERRVMVGMLKSAV